jgi:hypothetical protein
VWTQVRLATLGGRFSVSRRAQERFGCTKWAKYLVNSGMAAYCILSG